MKKLIAISVVFALIAGTAFAVDLGGTVFGHVNVIEGSTAEGSEITASGGMDRVRIDGSGETGDGDFGGYIRLDNGDVGSANAWWKPIDQFKLIIGNNSDGFWGKEGVTGWSFNQMPNDSGVAINYGIWYGDGWGSSVYGNTPYMHNRYTFFGGFGDNAALLEIKPVDVLGINIAIPFMRGGTAVDVFKQTVAQIDVNLDFGNIAITYVGGKGYEKAKAPEAVWNPEKGKKDAEKGWVITGKGTPETKDDDVSVEWGETAAAKPATPGWELSGGSDEVDDPGAIFAYFGGSFGDLGIDFGLGYHLAKADGNWAQPIGIGLGVKYAVDSFGIKFRTTAALAGDDKATYINASLLPYYAISDTISAFLNAGLGLTMPSVGDAVVGWYANPYLRVGAEWSPTFYFGIQVSSDGGDAINFAVPISLMVSF